MRNRLKREKPPVDIDITAFMNLMVVLVPFLLMTAVFSHTAVIDLNLPKKDDKTHTKNNKETFAISVTIRPDALYLTDNKNGLIKVIEKKGNEHDFAVLTGVLKQVKARFLDLKNITILSEQNTAYSDIIKTMDSVRSYSQVVNGEVLEGELFPVISIGDAVQTAKGKK